MVSPKKNTEQAEDKQDLELQQAAALVQAEGNRQLQECNKEIEFILDKYGYELVARVTVQGVTIPVPVTYQRKQ